MVGEIWTYVALKPNDGKEKVRPILIIGDDSNNQLKFVDIHYVIISSSAECGIYDVLLDEECANSIGLNRKSVIKTTKIYTGPKSRLGTKIAELPKEIKNEFYKKYKEYQDNLIRNFYIDDNYKED